MEQYCQAIQDGEYIGIGERIINACPIITDIDLRNTGEVKSLYDTTDLECTVKFYFDAFDKYFQNLEPHMFSCVVLEKSPYKDGDVVKHGFHLHFPYLCLRLDDHINHLFPELEQHINKHFRREVFDAGIIKTPWLLYGSQKSNNKEPYMVTCIYDKNMNIITPEQAFEKFEIRSPAGKIITPTKHISYYYPYILSTNCQYKNILDIQVDIMESNLIKQITQPIYHITNKTNYVTLTDTQYAENIQKVGRLLPILNDSRASNHNDWKRVGWMLFNTCGPSQEVLGMWMEFSKRTQRRNYDPQGCVNEWKKMQPGTLLMGSLYKWASHDNPVEFSKIIYEERSHDLFAALSATHYDIASLLYDEYKNFYKCTSIGAKRWYLFDNHTWRQIQDGTDLRHIISTELLERFKQARQKILDAARVTSDRSREIGGPTIDADDERLKQIDKVITCLKTTGFKDSIMRECCEIFYDEEFEAKLDANPNLIAFKNGVYELKTHNFRCGKHDDYISKHMPIDYEEYDPYHPEVLNIYKFLGQIFPDKSIRDYFIQVNSQIFMGGNKDKKVFIWTGEGDNGKSVTCGLFEKMLGPYAQKPPTSLLTEKRAKATQADPAMSRSQGARWLVFQEPSEKDDINCGVLKELSGNDTFTARDLYQKGADMREITPMFKVVLMCNKPPNIFDADRAVWNRISVIPFESTFVTAEDLPATEEEQLLEKKFPMDPEFSEKIPKMLKAFAWLLLDKFKQNGGKIGVEPYKVHQATKAYRARNDILQQFTQELIEKDPMGQLSIVELYTSFKQWYTNTGYSIRDLMTRQIFRDAMCKFLGEPDKKNVWKGHRFVQDDFET
jgi:P4 family phage/plasmid primase-like protien